MSNELDTTDEQSALLRQLEESAQAGNLALTFQIDVPLKLTVEATGAITMDCPCLAFPGISHAVILRIQMSPLAAQSMKRGLDALETIQGEPTSTAATRSTH